MITFTDIIIAAVLASVITSIIWAAWGVHYLKGAWDKTFPETENTKAIADYLREYEGEQHSEDSNGGQQACCDRDSHGKDDQRS
jgi:hypothetical protein